MQTWAAYSKGERTDSVFIPLSCWSEPIRKLDPLYVYHHRFNIVVVLNRKDGTEEGIYIQNPVSSFRFMKGQKVDGFELKNTDEKGLTHFVRERKQEAVNE